MVSGHVVQPAVVEVEPGASLAGRHIGSTTAEGQQDSSAMGWGGVGCNAMGCDVAGCDGM